eukprot:3265576-Rhodomonas_salina.3
MPFTDGAMPTKALQKHTSSPSTLGRGEVQLRLRGGGTDGTLSSWKRREGGARRSGMGCLSSNAPRECALTQVRPRQHRVTSFQPRLIYA